MVPNRIRGKAHVICEESGANFNIKTIFPFTGQIFAHDRKRTPNCVHTFRESWNINISFSYAECGIKNSGDRESAAQTQFHLQIIVMFEQPDGTSSIQSFMAQCIHQKINYNKQLIPKRIEEALEELKLVPAKLEQKAPMPIAEMKIVKEVEHHAEGDGEDISKVDVGQPLRIEWNLKPESDAYGFHVRDCYVTDAVDGARHQVIDERGCSTDINILGHPHYDTYHDIARVHWHAFKVPDNTVLSIKCNIQICTDIPDSSSGLTSCDAIPTPPFCPDLVTSPTNSILFDVQGNIVKRNVGIQKSFSTHVHADICFGNSTDGYCNSKAFEKARLQHLERIHKETDNKFCTSRLWLAAISGLTLWTVILAVGLNIIFFIRHKWIKTGH
uniref:ZP domain-containing protein n=1 Tax=Panagrolaimus superbus TaxID=310955 RepID=A0A914Y6Y6_9BILA